MMNFDFYARPYTKINSICFINLNGRTKMITLLEGNRCINNDFVLGVSCLDMTSKAQQQQKNI